jgi:hypothetical protein
MKKLVGAIAAVAAVATIFGVATGIHDKAKTRANITSPETYTIEDTAEPASYETAYSERTSHYETMTQEAETYSETAGHTDSDYYETESFADTVTPYTPAKTSHTASVTKPRTTEFDAEAPISDCDYILNTNTGKFHYPTCNSVKQMKEKNKEYFNGSRSTVIEMGYVPCKNCNP